jgi:hypothetical protein
VSVARAVFAYRVLLAAFIVVASVRTALDYGGHTGPAHLRHLVIVSASLEAISAA